MKLFNLRDDSTFYEESKDGIIGTLHGGKKSDDIMKIYDIPDNEQTPRIQIM